MTVKRWVPDVKALSPTVVAFALSVLERLECPAPVATVPPAPVVAEGAVDGEEMEMDMDEDKEVVEEVLKITEVKDGKVVDHLPPPTTLDEVLQHVELFLALCVTYPALLVSYVSLPSPRLDSELTRIPTGCSTRSPVFSLSLRLPSSLSSPRWSAP